VNYTYQNIDALITTVNKTLITTHISDSRHACRNIIQTCGRVFLYKTKTSRCNNISLRHATPIAVLVKLLALRFKRFRGCTRTPFVGTAKHLAPTPKHLAPTPKHLAPTPKH
jgi:hypothetical protein